jgi:hypothetical protein
MAVGLAAVFAAVVLSACNPQGTTPQVGVFGSTAMRYDGPRRAWLEVSETGGGGVETLGLTLVRSYDVKGPTERDCIGSDGSVEPCAISDGADAVAEPNDIESAPQVNSRPAGTYVRFMTVYPGEVVHVFWECHGDRQYIECDNTLRATLRTVDEGSVAFVGDLTVVTGQP